MPVLTPSQLYCSPEGEAELAAAYDRTRVALPFPTEERVVATRFGTAHVLAAGPAAAPPLLLWHGAAAPAPYMLASFPQLAEHFRVYAPDTPCQGEWPALCCPAARPAQRGTHPHPRTDALSAALPSPALRRAAGGRSEHVVLDAARHEWGAWCRDVLMGLGLLGGGQPPPFHVGVSMGCSLLLDLAAVEPGAIRAAACVSPGALTPNEGCGAAARPLPACSAGAQPSAVTAQRSAAPRAPSRLLGVARSGGKCHPRRNLRLPVSFPPQRRHPCVSAGSLPSAWRSSHCCSCTAPCPAAPRLGPCWP